MGTYWAHQCIWDHHSNSMGSEQKEQYETLCNANGCFAYGYDSSSDAFIGENMACSGTSSSNPGWNMVDLLDGIEAWYDEAQYYHWDTQAEFDVVGHWTAGTWAKSRYLGCGYANCDFNSPFSSYTNWINFVCKQYPGGNYGNGQPYTEGTSCSDCEDDRSTCSGDNSALCDGGMCLNCAVDYFQDVCAYDDASCPSSMYYGDGINTPAPTTDPTTDVPDLGESNIVTTASPTTATTATATTCSTAVSDPDCDCGIESDNGLSCCPTSCGMCGGAGCQSAPGGETDCCQQWASGISCDDDVAPCEIQI